MTGRWSEGQGEPLDAVGPDQTTSPSTSEERTRITELEELYESVVQTLDAIGNGMIPHENQVRYVARGEAHRLRQILHPSELAENLDRTLADLAAEFAMQGLEVEHSTGDADHLKPEALEALASSVRAALNDVVTQGDPPTVVVRAIAVDGGMQVTVRHQGKGFDSAGEGGASQLARQSDLELASVGGWSSWWSEPGRGTRRTIWVPVSGMADPTT
jgi:signal transduction histidine kinase